MADRIAAMTRAGIPVIAHVGLLPQIVHASGGYRFQGRDVASAKQLLEDTLADDRLQRAYPVSEHEAHLPAETIDEWESE